MWSLKMAEQRRLDTLLGHLKASGPAPASGQPSSYRYTLDSCSEGVLTPEQRRSYEEDGFFVVKGLVSQRHLDTYRERFRQICSREVKVSGLWSQLLVTPCKEEGLGK